MVWDWGSVEGLSCRVRGSIAKTDSKALLREFDTAKRHERRGGRRRRMIENRVNTTAGESKIGIDVEISGSRETDRETGREK